MDRARLLIADCHEDTLIALQKVLEDAGFDTSAVWTAKEFIIAIRSQVFDLVLVNEYIPGRRCEELLRELQESHLRYVLMQPRRLAATETPILRAWGTLEAVDKHDHAEVVRLVRKILGREDHNSAA